MSNVLVHLQGVSVRYGSNEVLKDVTLDIYEDDFLGIIGPNGGGKTTLVKAILGMVTYTGTITLSSQLKSDGVLRIGYMPQVSAFDRKFPISLVEMVLSGLQNRKGFFGRYKNSDRQRALELLMMAGLEDVSNHQIGEVSGGQLQRALLCRAVIQQPKLLILDEPANFVDNKFENELYTMLEKLSSQMAIVMVSHDIGTITSVVRSIVCVNLSVHRHNSNHITQEQLDNYHCPIQIVSHGPVAHTVLLEHTGWKHDHSSCCHHKHD